ncbi:DUF6491 family protein [Stutzerimonas kirkiae]|uniref:Lipoprotein n=1 Tax=Stutzerimonas kirkiae TaxID=2211392 RepID=A0A4Q9RBL9_9GAMM|nr:DUF6491 family protein [Stutzerimonas kirkiae]TBU98302.1 hypothetical protein DNJ96_05815 [Stutzerimonas kirkiae]TBV01938.1 hypothetical protein DNJ95_10335 [Stutzerimonas kirkiae]TBV06974.1 hypothetical protein DNK08_13745 [Stutzerimonas kirkiae]TBV16242.1 hypothetical protein DNK01_04595 [Stutzerimonas kirkiae]
MRSFGSVLVLGLSALLGACGTSAIRDESLPLAERLAMLDYRQAEEVRSIQRYDIDGWQYLDKLHLILDGGPRRAYLIEFSSPCRNLAFSNRIGYSTTVGSLSRLDRIISTDGSGFPEHCLIGNIYRLEHIEKNEE